MRAALFGLLAAQALVACNFAKPDAQVVPANPTFVRDVEPILANHCTLCHSEPSNFGAPHYFRLDRFENSDSLLGAKAMADEILRQIQQDAMPPAAAWGDGVGPNDKKIIELWVEQGSN